MSWEEYRRLVPIPPQPKWIQELIAPRSKASKAFSPVEADILEKLRNGEAPPRGSNDKEVTNALTKLRRNGHIVNVGARRNPIWKLKEDVEH
jgi:hypothetical protein